MGDLVPNVMIFRIDATFKRWSLVGDQVIGVPPTGCVNTHLYEWVRALGTRPGAVGVKFSFLGLLLCFLSFPRSFSLSLSLSPEPLPCGSMHPEACI